MNIVLEIVFWLILIIYFSAILTQNKKRLKNQY